MTKQIAPAVIKRLRENQGWTQRELADRCGVSIRTVENWEQGRTKQSGPALLILKKIIENTS
jgi:putative transcriptional regulator